MVDPLKTAKVTGEKKVTGTANPVFARSFAAIAMSRPFMFPRR